MILLTSFIKILLLHVWNQLLIQYINSGGAAPPPPQPGGQFGGPPG
jgi:hypothetical protein